MFRLENVVAPLDFVRGVALRFATRSELATRVMKRRDSRIAVLGTAQVLLLLAITVRWPVALYFLGPVVLGVIHLAADVRYLVFRQPLPRRFLASSLGFAIALTSARVCVSIGAIDPALGGRIDIVLGMTWMGLALAWRLGARPYATLSVLAFVAFSAAIMLSHARAVDLALTHLHNVAAFVLWFALFRRRPSWAVLPVVATFVAAAFLLSGASQRWTAQHGGLAAFGEAAIRLATSFAPGATPRLAVSIATTFIFLQSIHYAVWTGWIAQDCLPGEGTPTFRMSVRSLTADFGAWVLLAIVLVTVAFAGLSCWNLRLSVGWYMTLARSHVWFELAVFAYLVGRDRTVAAVCTNRRAGSTTPENLAPTTTRSIAKTPENKPLREVRRAA